MSGDVRLLHLYASMVSTGTIYLYLCLLRTASFNNLHTE